MMRNEDTWGYNSILKVFAVVILISLGLSQVCAEDQGSSIDLSYYKGQYISDTIPSLLEGGKSYPVTIRYRNAGMVSWTWDVEKFGMLYTGKQSSIEVTPEFFQLRPDQKVSTGSEFTFNFTLTPPEKTGEYEISFSMATMKGNQYSTFVESFIKKVSVVSKSGISSGSVGAIIIESVPSGADVSLGRKRIGVTPLTIPDLSPASYELSVSHPDYRTKVIPVKVEEGSVSRFMVDLTTPGIPKVSTVKDERFTILGFMKEKFPLIIFSIVIFFFGIQLMMLDTKRFPENHSIRRIVKPITFIPVSFSGSRMTQSGSQKGHGSSGSSGDGSTGVHIAKGATTSSYTTGGIGAKPGKLTDKKTEYSGDQKAKQSTGEEKQEEEKVPEVDQEYHDIDNPFGFPDGLKDRYEPLGVAGDDEYARVFKVRKKETGTVRALKVSHVKGAGSEILQKESSVWGNLRHPNVVRLYKAEFDDDLTFLDLEFLDGIGYKGEKITSLASLPKPIKEKYAVSLMRDIAAGLKYTHYLGIRHYHIQPGDILLTPKMRAKISGYARGKNELGFSIPDSDTKEAPEAYITPEQRDEQRYGNPGRKTDIYQLGVIFYELLTGHLPYSKEAAQAGGINGWEESGENRLILPSEFRGFLGSFDKILSRMLSLEKNGRYSSVDEFINDLDALSGNIHDLSS